VAAVKDRSRRHACAKQRLQVWLGGNEIILIGDIDPALDLPRKCWRLRPQPLIDDGLEAKRRAERQEEGERLLQKMRCFVRYNRTQRMPDDNFGFGADQFSD